MSSINKNAKDIFNFLCYIGTFMEPWYGLAPLIYVGNLIYIENLRCIKFCVTMNKNVMKPTYICEVI